MFAQMITNNFPHLPLTKDPWKIEYYPKGLRRNHKLGEKSLFVDNALVQN